MKHLSNSIVAKFSLGCYDNNEQRRQIDKFQKELDFGVTSVNYNLNELLARADPPE